CTDSGQHRTKTQAVRLFPAHLAARLVDELDDLGLLWHHRRLKRLDASPEFVEGVGESLAMLGAEYLNHAGRGIGTRLNCGHRAVEVVDRLSRAPLLLRSTFQVRRNKDQCPSRFSEADAPPSYGNGGHLQQHRSRSV